MELALDVETAALIPTGCQDLLDSRSALSPGSQAPESQSRHLGGRDDDDADFNESSTQLLRRSTDLNITSSPFVQRSLGGILSPGVRKNRSNAPSPVSAAFPRRGELPEWHPNSPTQITPKSNEPCSPAQDSSQRGLLPNWPPSLLMKKDEGNEVGICIPEDEASDEGWGTPQSTPGKDNGNSAAKTETEIAESSWPLSLASSDKEEPSPASTDGRIVVPVKVSTGDGAQLSNEAGCLTDLSWETNVAQHAAKLGSESSSSVTKPRERPRPNTGFLQRQLQSIMRFDKPRVRPVVSPETFTVEDTVAQQTYSPFPDSTQPSQPKQQYHTGLTPELSSEELSVEEISGQHRETPDVMEAADPVVDGTSSSRITPASPRETKDDGEVEAPPRSKASPTTTSALRAIETAAAFLDKTLHDVEDSSSSSGGGGSRPSSAMPSPFPSACLTKADDQTPLPTDPSLRIPSEARPSAPCSQSAASIRAATAAQSNNASSVGAPATARAGSGGALGLFTFTHNLRPTAAPFTPTVTRFPQHSLESRPTAAELRSVPSELHSSETEYCADDWRLGPSGARPNQGLGHHPFALDLSKANPTSRPFERGGACLLSNEGRIRIGNGEESLVIPPKRPVKIARPQSPTASLPRREPASPRHGQQAEPPVSEEVSCRKPEASDIEDPQSDEDRALHRYRRHTAKRSSQNSYLSKARSTSKALGSPERRGDYIKINPSQPVKGPESRNSVETHQKRPSLNPTAKPFLFGQGSIFSPVSTLPQNAVGGPPPHRPAAAETGDVYRAKLKSWVFPASGRNALATKNAHKRRHSNGQSNSDLGDQSPAAALHGLETETSDGMPKAGMDEWSDWPGPLTGMVQLRADRTGESVEFPLRRDSGQAIEVIQADGFSPSNSRVSSGSDSAMEHGLAAEILDKLESVEQQLTSVKLGNERAIEEAFGRVDLVTQSSAIKALNALRGRVIL